DLQIDDYLQYSRRFGLIDPHPSKVTRHPDCPEITLLGVNKFAADGKLDMAIYRRGAEGFHTDGAYDQVPFKATQLYALADGLKQRLDGLQGVYVYGGRRKKNVLLNEEDRHEAPALHPIVRTHAE